MTGDEEVSRVKGSESARRVLDILFSFRPGRPEVTVKEVASELGIPLPSAHRYIALLRQQGVVTESKRGRYHLTLRVLTLAEAAHAATSLVEVAEPYLRELVGLTGETALIVQLVGNRCVCMHQQDAPRRIQLSFEPGQSLPPLHGASARVLLGALPDKERRAYIHRELEEQPELVSPCLEFENDVALAAERGWATSTEEIEEGVWTAAALIRHQGQGVAALSMPCPLFRLTETKRHEVLEYVRKMALAISHALDGHGAAQ